MTCAEPSSLERLWNELSEREPFTLLCGYSAAHFIDAHALPALHAICGAHTRVQKHTSDLLGNWLISRDTANDLNLPDPSRSAMACLTGPPSRTQVASACIGRIVTAAAGRSRARVIDTSIGTQLSSVSSNRHSRTASTAARGEIGVR